MDKTVIREATAADAARISEIVTSCYCEHEFTDGFSPALIEELIGLRGTEQSIERLIEDEFVLVAVRDEAIVGMISVSQNEITKLYVATEAQRQGVGARLFRHAERLVAKHGFAALLLGVVAPSAIPFYEKMNLATSETREIRGGPCKGRTVTILTKQLV